MTMEPDALGPMLQPGTITTLVGPVNDELAALTAALAVSWRLGIDLVPGWVPEGPGEVSLSAYELTWADWRGLMTAICLAAGVKAPLLELHCLDAPYVEAMALVPAHVESPAEEAFWYAYTEAEVLAPRAEARKAGRRLPSRLHIIYGVGGAVGPGGDEAMRRLYDKLRGETVLMVGAETGAKMAESYGPVIELPDLHNSVRWHDLLARITGGDGANAAAEAEAASDLEVLFAANAPAPNVGRLARDVAPNGGPGTLYGYFVVFGEWREINSRLEGNFLQRIAPSALARTIRDDGARMEVCFGHGGDPRFGDQSLGPITELQEDGHGVFYAVKLLDVDYCRELALGLKAGEFGSSCRFQVMADAFVWRPGKSADNPRGIPEQTILEMRVQEFGPVRDPAYKGSSAGLLEPHVEEGQ